MFLNWLLISLKSLSFYLYSKISDCKAEIYASLLSKKRIEEV